MFNKIFLLFFLFLSTVGYSKEYSLNDLEKNWMMDSIKLSQGESLNYKTNYPLVIIDINGDYTFLKKNQDFSFKNDEKASINALVMYPAFIVLLTIFILIVVTMFLLLIPIFLVILFDDADGIVKF